MSWLSRLSLVQRGLIALMSIVAIAFGAIAIPQLKQQLLPSIELPMVSVIAPYQGASPDVVEKQVIEPLEDGIQAVDGIKGVTSTSSEGSGVIMAQFDYGNDSKRLVADVQQAVNRARAKLPEGRRPAGRERLDGRHPHRRPRRLLVVQGPADARRPAGPQRRTGPEEHRRRQPGHRGRRPGPRRGRHPRRQEARRGRASTPQALGKALQAGGTSVPAGSFAEDGQSKTVQVGAGFTSVRQIRDLPLAPAAAPGAPRRGRGRRPYGRAGPARRRRHRQGRGGGPDLPDPHQRQAQPRRHGDDGPGRQRRRDLRRGQGQAAADPPGPRQGHRRSRSPPTRARPSPSRSSR